MSRELELLDLEEVVRAGYMRVLPLGDSQGPVSGVAAGESVSNGNGNGNAVGPQQLLVHPSPAAG
jgi:hypothetical protein